MSLDSNSISPSRTYVAMCNKVNFDGYYFRKFNLPHQDPRSGRFLTNDNQSASWYFLNRVDGVACIQGCIAFEDFCDVMDEQQVQQGINNFVYTGTTCYCRMDNGDPHYWSPACPNVPVKDTVKV